MPERFHVERSLVIAAAVGAGLGASWILLGIWGWALTGAVIAWLVITYVINARWAEIGALLLLTGLVPIPFLAVRPVVTSVDAGLTEPRATLGAAVILAVMGLATLVGAAFLRRRNARHIFRRPR